MTSRGIPRAKGRWARNQAARLFDIPIHEARRISDPRRSRQVVPGANLTDVQVLTLQLTVQVDRLLGDPAPEDARDATLAQIADTVLGRRMFDAYVLLGAGQVALAPTYGDVSAGLHQRRREVVSVLPVGAWAELITTHSPAAQATAAITVPVVGRSPALDEHGHSLLTSPAGPGSEDRPWSIDPDEVFADATQTLWGDPAMTCLEPVVTDMLGRSAPGPAPVMVSEARADQSASTPAAAPSAPAPEPSPSPSSAPSPASPSEIAPAQLEAIARGVTEGLLKHLYPQPPTASS